MSIAFSLKLFVVSFVTTVACSLLFTSPVQADVSTTTEVYPVGDISIAANWLKSNTSSPNFYSLINDPTVDNTRYIYYNNSANNGAYFRIGYPEYQGQLITKLKFNTWCAVENGWFDTVDSMDWVVMYGPTATVYGTGTSLIDIQRSTCLVKEYTANTWNTIVYTIIADGSTTNGTRTVVTGSWAPGTFNNISYGVSKFNASTSNTIRIPKMSVEFTYINPPQWNQNKYRVYAANSSLTPGTPLAAENTMATLTAQGDPFRIRMGVNVGGVSGSDPTWLSGFGTYRLQYAKKNSTCAASSFQNIGISSGDIRWNDASPTNGATISSYANDPSGTKSYQTYREADGTFTTSGTIAVGTMALWDFSLREYSTEPGAVYCFRIVKTDAVSGYESMTYSAYPEVRVVGDLGVSIVTDALDIIPSPELGFSTLFRASTCQVSNATIGGGANVRVRNDTANPGWSLSIAATNGATAKWTSIPTGEATYDYNDSGGSPAGCSDSAVDTDTIGGQLSLRPAQSNVAPESGCSNTGITKGINASFVENSVNAITLLSANASAPTFCGWLINNLEFVQRIPALQHTAGYYLDVTLTAVAL